ncbi:uncharacterized protein VP01_5240g2 [Puccinia sorghi]|uniref:Autophagy-related protein 2 n=1 Tax=Puccinia sorghi TaxID=27349 RepID=A0A0L6UMH8_9BASI|nr:uncharacterized protein VP01_5240g2 [Puccinia sorghi]
MVDSFFWTTNPSGLINWLSRKVKGLNGQIPFISKAQVFFNILELTGKIGKLLQETWTPDVKANQLEDVISGIGPMQLVVNLRKKIVDLVLLPIEEMKKKDGHLNSGIQRGTSPFAKNTTLEVINPMPFSKHSSSQREARPRITYHCIGKMALSLQVNRKKLSLCSRAPLTCLISHMWIVCYPPIGEDEIQANIKKISKGIRYQRDHQQDAQALGTLVALVWAVNPVGLILL